MKLKRSFLLIALSVVAMAIMSGCDVAGTVIDLSNAQTDVTGMHVSGKGTITAFSGGAVHEIALDALESISLYQGETRVINGELYLVGDVFFKDGTHMSSHDKLHDNAALTFISVNATILGKSNRGDFSADLSNVLKITVR
jgi:predicted heme/steroid binding protein